MTCNVRSVAIADLQSSGLVDAVPGKGLVTKVFDYVVKNATDKVSDMLSAKYGIDESFFLVKEGRVMLNEDAFRRAQNKETGVSEDLVLDTKKTEPKIKPSLKIAISKLGIKNPVFVDELVDMNGVPLQGVAAAEIADMAIKMLKGEQSKLTEEAVHFYVQALMELNDPGYVSMINLLPGTKELEAAIASHLGVEGYEFKHIQNEAITHIILDRISDQSIDDRASRWWARMWNRLKLILDVESDPYTKAAWSMFVNNLDEHREALLSSNETVVYRSMSPTQASVMESIKKDHEALFIEEYNKNKANGSIKNFEWFEDENGIVARYVFKNKDGAEEKVEHRATDESTVSFIKSMRSLKTAKTITNLPKSRFSRNAGTVFHDALNSLMQTTLVNNPKTYPNLVFENLNGRTVESEDKIRTTAKMSPDQFKVIQGQVKKLLDEMNSDQAKKNALYGTPDGKAYLMTEVRVYERKTSTAGTMDILLILSDGHAQVHDYKFISPGQYFLKGYGANAKIYLDPYGGGKIDSYESQLSFYTRTLRSTHGIVDVDKSRIIPGHITFKYDRVARELTPEVESIQMSETENRFLQSIPVANELSTYSTIKSKLEELYNMRDQLNSQQNTATVRKKKRIIQTAIQELILEGDFKNLSNELKDTLNKISKYHGETDVKSDTYISDEELYHDFELISLFSDIAETTHSMRADVKERSKEKGEEVDAVISVLSGHIAGAIAKAEGEIHKRQSNKSKKKDINVVSAKPGMMDWLVPMSDIDNPIFQEAYHRITRAIFKKSQRSEALRLKWVALEQELYKWGDIHEAYDHLIQDSEFGLSLVSMFTDEFKEEVESMTSEDPMNLPDHVLVKNKKWMTERFKERKGAKEDYAIALKQTREYLAREYGLNSDQYKQALLRFEKNNNIWAHPSAWVSPKYWKYLEVDQEKHPQAFNEKYSFLLKPENKALLDFHKAWKDQMREFNKELGEKHVFLDMVPGIRTSLVEKIASNQPLTWDVASEWLTRSMVVHTEEGDHSAGDPPKVIPLKYTETPRGKKGEINPSLVSRDLAKSMYMFGDSVYNHIEKSNIETDILSLRLILSKTKELQGSDSKLKLRKSGRTNPDNMSTGTMELYDALINAYLYDHSYSTKDFKIMGMSAQKFVNVANKIMSTTKISMPVKLAISTQIAGTIALNAEVTDSIHLNNEDMFKGLRLWQSDYDSYMELSEYFDIHQEGMLMHRSRKMRTSTADRWLDRSMLYEPLTMVDRSIDRRVAIAMLHSHGLNGNGELKRLSQLPEGSKSLIEILDAKDGKINGEMSEDARYDFKKRVQEIVRGVKGDQGEENLLAAHTLLAARAMGTFKWWMPGTVQSRMGGIRYSYVLDEIKEGRFSGTFKSMTAKEMIAVEEGFMNTTLSYMNSAVSALGHLAGIQSYRISNRTKARLEAEKKWTPEKNAAWLRKREMLQLEMDLIKQNSTDPRMKNMTDEEFFSMREASVIKTLVELRSMLALVLLNLAIGLGSGPDDEEWYKQSYASRRLADVLAKIVLESTFYINPNEFVKLTKSALPLATMIAEGAHLVYKVFEGGLKTVGAIDNSPNETSALYYTLKWVPGWNQSRGWIEAFPQDKKVWGR